MEKLTKEQVNKALEIEAKKGEVFTAETIEELSGNKGDDEDE